MIPLGDESIMCQHIGGACRRALHAEGLEGGTLSYVTPCWMLLMALCASSDWYIFAWKFRWRPLCLVTGDRVKVMTLICLRTSQRPFLERCVKSALMKVSCGLWFKRASGGLTIPTRSCLTRPQPKPHVMIAMPRWWKPLWCLWATCMRALLMFICTIPDARTAAVLV